MADELVTSPGPGRCGEWVGGIISFPSYVADEGEPYRPAAVLWVEIESGLIVGSQLVRPEEVLKRAPALFLETTREPQAGPPRIPARVRVAAADLVDALRGRIGDVEVVAGPTPELDPVVASLREHMAALPDDDDDEGLTYLGPGITPDDVAHLFRAAARLYRVRPWMAFPVDGFASVACDILGIDDGALCVVGQMGESFGFALFHTVEDAVAYTQAAGEMEQGGEPAIPQFVMFSYDDREKTGPVLAHEIEEHGWEIAGPEAYPSAFMIDEDRVTRGLTLPELVGTTAIIDAIAELVERAPNLADFWAEDAPSVSRSTVTTRLGPVSVDIGTPLWLPGVARYDEPAARKVRSKRRALRTARQKSRRR